jgi:hypothetical protein
VSNVPVANEINIEMSDFWALSVNSTKRAAAEIAPILPKILNKIIHPRMIITPHYYLLLDKGWFKKYKFYDRS